MASEVLSEARQKERLQVLESTVKKGFEQFLEVGRALAEIRDQRLYKADDFKSFGDYVKTRFNYNLSYCNYVMNTADMIRRLETSTITTSEDDDDVPPFDMPTTEAQCKALAPLIKKDGLDDAKMEQIKEVLTKIKKEDVRPSAKAIQATIAELYPDTRPPEKDPTEFNERSFGRSVNTICAQMQNIREDDLRNFFAERAAEKELFISEIRKLLVLLEG